MSGPIVLNGRAMVRARITGVERLAHEIIGRLLVLRPDVYRLLSPAAARLGPALQSWEQFVLPVRAARARAALVYSPANLAPLAWPRNVVVLHDASVWRSPASYSGAYRAWHRVAEVSAVRRALGVITVSEFSRRELSEVLGLDPERISVIPNGVSSRFGTDADPELARRRYGLRAPYVLALASAQARKNLELLGAVARRLAGDGVELVLAGGASATGQPGPARVIGYVPDDHLPGLYAGAGAFLFPSRYEGFGIPCLEAMACGTPVVAAAASALPETCGDAALLSDPDDPEAFIAAVQRVLSDTALRAQLRARGLRRSSQFTWERAAAATDELLTRLAGVQA